MMKELIGALLLAFVVLQPPPPPPNGGGSPGGGSPGGGAPPFGTGLNVNASVDDADVPIGTEVTLTCTHAAVQPPPTYHWDATCNIFEIGPQVEWWTKPPWNTKEIKDCPGGPGTVEYRVTVAGGPSNASTTVTYHAPDEADVSLGAVTLPPPVDTGGVTVQQVLETTLTWNDEPIGPCASVCAQERILKKSHHPLFNWLKADSRGWPGNVDGWMPRCPQSAAGFTGDEHRPGLMTYGFFSPKLTDVTWGHFNASSLAQFQTMNLHAVNPVMTKTHEYRFTGGSVCGGIWQIALTIEMVLEMKTVNGQNIPVWRIAS